MNKNFSLNKTFATASVAVAAASAIAVSGAGIANAAGAHGKTSAPRCLVSELSVSIVQGSPGAGQRYATVTLKNTGKVACSTGGYVGLGLTSSTGKALATNAVREDQKKVAVLTLEPGQKASELLQWSVIGGTGKCVNNAAHLLVTPPNDYHSFVMPWKYGSVCENGRITEQPLKAVRGK